MFCYFFVIDVKTMHFSFRSFIIITFSKVEYFTDVIISTRIVLTTILERKRADMASDVHHASIYVYIMAQRKQESSARFSLVRLHMTASWVSRRGIRRRAVGFIRFTARFNACRDARHTLGDCHGGWRGADSVLICRDNLTCSGWLTQKGVTAL